MQIASRQSILPIIHRGLKKTDASADIIREYDRARLMDTKQYILQNDALTKINAVLDSARIPFIPLKGAVLRNLYPAPEMRTSCDIDVLVRERDADQAAILIEASTDFRAEKRYYHDISMFNTQTHLELHFSILEDMDAIDKLLAHVWDYVELDEGSRYKLTPEFQVFHILAHMSYHMIHGGLGIRPFLDLWLLRKKTNYEEDTVRQMCSDCGILLFYESCCCLVDAWMTGQPAPKDLVIFERYALNGGVFGDSQSTLAAKQREHRGISYLYHRLFMSRAKLETEYPELKDKPYLMPIYQDKRWLRVLNPKKRMQIKQEIKSIRNMSKDDIESFDKLLNSVGL